jgi:tetratricopeptide (TPR) repeat protein
VNHAKQLAQSSGKKLEEVVQAFSNKALGDQPVVMLDGVRTSASKAEAQALYRAAEADPDAAQEVVTKFDIHSFLQNGISSYREGMRAVLDSSMGETVPRRMSDRLMAWDGLTADEFMRLRHTLNRKVKPPKGKFAVETSDEKVRREAYRQAGKVMDELADSLPDNKALETFYKGQKMYEVVANYTKAQKIIQQGMSYNADGDLVYSGQKVLNKLHNMNPRELYKMFGSEVGDTIKTLQRAQLGRSAAKKEQARKNANKAVRNWIYTVGAVTGLTYAANKIVSTIGQEAFGMGSRARGMAGAGARGVRPQ